MKKLLNKENLLITLLIGLIGHNIFLQTRVETAIQATQDAESAANQAENRADDAARYSFSALNNSKEAAENAEEAIDAAWEANHYTFGRINLNSPKCR